MDEKSARFTILIDADKKQAFDAMCAAQEMTTSEMIRKLIQGYLDAHGVTYTPAQSPVAKERRPRKAA